MNSKEQLNALIACLENAKADEFNLIKMTTQVRDIMVEKLKELKQFKTEGNKDAKE